MNRSLIYIGLGAAGLYAVSRLAQLPEQAKQAASTAAHYPLQMTRDNNADGSTPGTQAWFSNQWDQLTRVISGKPKPVYSPSSGLITGIAPSDPDIAIWYE